ncbi:hypothetical protein M378DRAFT_154724 [Amanita muscaria Koide BX008]|uniref:Uncharacterized protein n=1 Tax=Amanita muscaria (strain Koide BX008) TaxID=946122 RepID=A0A0C2XPT8_AMAMK|nr:hypothetical protein M378DRAFT_154724 [Amanita muscaria Koide BX008]
MSLFAFASRRRGGCLALGSLLTPRRKSRLPRVSHLLLLTLLPPAHPHDETRWHPKPHPIAT